MTRDRRPRRGWIRQTSTQHNAQGAKASNRSNAAAKIHMLRAKLLEPRLRGSRDKERSSPRRERLRFTFLSWREFSRRPTQDLLCSRKMQPRKPYCTCVDHGYQRLTASKSAASASEWMEHGL
jgi:hypothetical protein